MYTDDLITREELNEKIGGMKQQIEKLENDLKLIEYNLNKGDQLEEIIQRTFKNKMCIRDRQRCVITQIWRFCIRSAHCPL